MLCRKNEKFLCTAFTGVAASLLTGGETIHSLFQFHVGKKKYSNLTSNLTDTALRMMHAKFKDCKYIIIDEISMVGSLLLYKIHNRLQEITGSCLPFGGINILVVGDFFQIIPVGDSCLYKDIIKYIVLQNDDKIMKNNNKTHKIENEFSTIGALLFSKFKLLTLNDQVRAADDVEQMKTLTSLRSFNGNQVSNTLLQSLIQNNTLDKIDFENNKSIESNTWNTAPLAVTSNCERDHLMFLRAQKWAQMKGVPIITWNLQCRGAVVNYIIENNSKQEIFHNQSGLIGIFVQGAM
jgi:PIF1-like helicase/Phosphoglucose isomerase